MGATAFTVIVPLSGVSKPPCSVPFEAVVVSKVVVANTKLALNQYRFTWVDAVFYVLSVGLWFAIATVYGLVSPGYYGGYPEWEWRGPAAPPRFDRDRETRAPGR